jgi:ferric-chelate reductase
MVWNDGLTRTGVMALVFLLMATFPVSKLGKRLIKNFEIRMGMHFLFIPFLVTLILHRPDCVDPLSNVYCVEYYTAALLSLYALHLMRAYLFQTYQVVQYQMFPTGKGTVVEYECPRNIGGKFTFKSGQYIKVLTNPFQACSTDVLTELAQVCIPWISKLQWHAFSAIHVEGHDDTEMCAFYCADVGWWTHQLYQSAIIARQQPIWIHRPIMSAFDSIKHHDYSILVATGAGITPAMSALSELSSRHSMFLIWICREPELVAYFQVVHYVCKTHRGDP